MLLYRLFGYMIYKTKRAGNYTIAIHGATFYYQTINNYFNLTYTYAMHIAPPYDVF